MRTALFSLLTAASLVLASPALGDTAGLAPVSGASWQPAPGDQIRFDVLRKGNEFGTHTVRFERGEDGGLIVDIDVDLRAGFGPITLFRYELDAREVWKDGRLVALAGRVNDDGTKEEVEAVRNGDGLKVDGDGFQGVIDGQVIPASHWNIAAMGEDALLSTENGEMLPVEITRQGRETLIIGGRDVEAERYLMDGDIDVTLWYDDAGRWLKLAFEARGQEIEYVLQELY